MEIYERKIWKKRKKKTLSTKKVRLKITDSESIFSEIIQYIQKKYWNTKINYLFICLNFVNNIK